MSDNGHGMTKRRMVITGDDVVGQEESYDHFLAYGLSWDELGQCQIAVISHYTVMRPADLIALNELLIEKVQEHNRSIIKALGMLRKTHEYEPGT